MRITTILGSALALFALAFVTTANTQMGGGSTAPSEPAPAVQAPQAPGNPGASVDLSESRQLQDQIDAAKKSGKNVNVAESEKKRGDAALAAGYKSEAAEHYARAAKQLGNLPIAQ